MKKSDTRRIRLHQACTALGINVTTLWRWIKRAEIKTQEDEADKRAQTISIADLRRLSRDHDRPLVLSYAETAMQDRSTNGDDRIASLDHRLAELENSTAYHSGEIETLVDGLEQRIEVLEQAVARLTELMQAKETPKILKPPQPHYSAKATVQEEQERVATVPEKQEVALKDFAELHGVAERTARDHAKAIGARKKGRVWYLDEEAQAKFIAVFHPSS